MSFQCRRCPHAGRYSSWVTARWHLGPTIQRCARCGTAHSCERGAGPVAIPPMLQNAIGTPFERLVIIGELENGEFYIAGSANAGETMILERV